MTRSIIPVVFLLISTAVFGQASHLTQVVVQTLQTKAHRLAVLRYAHHEYFDSSIVRNISLPITIWTYNGGKLDSQFGLGNEHLTQGGIFSTPGLVVVPWNRQLSRGISSLLSLFAEYHSNVDWIVSVQGQADVQDVLKSNPCHVIVVSDDKVNAPFDNYKHCKLRKVYRSAMSLLSKQTHPRESYPKNAQIYYGIYDRFVKNCCVAWMKSTKTAITAYRALNNTLICRCPRNIHTKSLLLSREVDVILSDSLVKCPKRNNSANSDRACFYYAFAVYPPISICFFVPRAGPIPPPFVKYWLSCFGVFLAFTPFAVITLVVVQVQSNLSQLQTLSLPATCMFMVSTILGRSPHVPGQGPNTAATKLLLATWMIGVFFACNFIQTDITSSQTVHPFSAPIGLGELNALLDSGKMKPYMNRLMAGTIRAAAQNVSHLKSLSRALDACGESCVDSRLGKPLEGAQAIVGKCSFSVMSIPELYNLTAGDDTLLTELRMSATHGRFPLR